MLEIFPIIDMEKTGEHLKSLMDEKNISVKEIQHRIGFEEPQAVYKWIWGKSLPTVDNLIRLECILGVTIDEILITTSHNAESSRPEPAAYNFFRQLNIWQSKNPNRTNFILCMFPVRGKGKLQRAVFFH